MAQENLFGLDSMKPQSIPKRYKDFVTFHVIATQFDSMERVSFCRVLEINSRLVHMNNVFPFSYGTHTLI